MPSRLPFLCTLLALALAAGVTGYLVSRKEPQVAAKPTAERASPQAEAGRQQVESRPMHRASGRAAALPSTDVVPAHALKNERIVRFKNNAAYRKFLADLEARGLTLLGKSERLLAVRVGFTSLADLAGIDGADLAFNYRVEIPAPPQGEAQAGAAGFGSGALAWLGVAADNSAWGRGVTVAVLDSGVNAGHLAFSGGVTTVELTALADGTAQLSHGTAVASIISGDHPLARGVAPASEILSFRVTDASGSSDSLTLAEGIMRAADAGAQVINISMGTFGNSALVADAVTYAQNRGAVIVASAGNEGVDTVAYPAAYPGVVAVGAVESKGEHLDFSNSGTELSITAPGYEVNAAWGEEHLTAFSGTSASAPFVSGAIAATMSNNPQMTARQAADLVLGLSNDAGLPGSDADYGAGILDVGRVMENGTPGIYDAAVTGQVLVPATAPNSLPAVWITIQNQGTETLINSPVTIAGPGGTQTANISSLSPGQTHTFQVPLALPADGSPVTVETTVTSAEGDRDAGNNSRRTSFSRRPE